MLAQEGQNVSTETRLIRVVSKNRHHLKLEKKRVWERNGERANLVSQSSYNESLVVVVVVEEEVVGVVVIVVAAS